MKTVLFILALFTLLFAGACYKTTPVDPVPDTDPSLRMGAELVIEGRTYTWIGLLGELADSRTRTAQDEVIPGTDMSPDELRQYFAWNIADASFKPYQCGVYPILLGMLAQESDFFITFMVYIMELNGWDVPNGPPPEPDCD